MNSISISGNLGKDCEVEYTPNGDPVAKFSVADNQGKDKPTIWWNCVLFGPRAESLSEYLVKGQVVTVIGRLTEREYEKNGEKRKWQEVRLNDIALQGGKREAQQPEDRPTRQAAQKRSAPSFSDMDDDIPFSNPYRGKYCFAV